LCFPPIRSNIADVLAPHTVLCYHTFSILARELGDLFVSKFLGIIKYPYNSIRKRDFSDKKTGKSFSLYPSP